MRCFLQEAILIQLIAPERYGEFTDALNDMHRLRYRVFKERLGWDVETAGDLEVDEYDALRPTYLLLRGPETRLGGCVRFLPSLGPTMLRDTFPALLPSGPFVGSKDVWESSRFAIDLDQGTDSGALGVAAATYEMFAGMVEFGLAQALTQIVTVTDLRVERILRRAGWPLDRLGPPRQIGKTQAVAGHLAVSLDALQTLRSRGQLTGPVLWAPVVQAA
jgi:N-acyl-L-homoserine lactone synthetase